MLKLCNKCNEEKSVQDFHNNPNTKDGRQGHCKSCHKSYYNNKKLVNGQIVHYVYYLPEHHYVGMTNNIDTRIYQHGQIHNRITEGYEIVGVYDTAIEAHYIETLLHLMGYEGFRGF